MVIQKIQSGLRRKAQSGATGRNRYQCQALPASHRAWRRPHATGCPPRPPGMRCRDLWTRRSARVWSVPGPGGTRHGRCRRAVRPGGHGRLAPAEAAAAGGSVSAPTSAHPMDHEGQCRQYGRRGYEKARGPKMIGSGSGARIGEGGEPHSGGRDDQAAARPGSRPGQRPPAGRSGQARQPAAAGISASAPARTAQVRAGRRPGPPRVKFALITDPARTHTFSVSITCSRSASSHPSRARRCRSNNLS